MANDEATSVVPEARRGGNAWRALAVLAALLALAVAGLVAFSTTETALRWAIAELQLRSGGALDVEGASGSLWSTIRADRVEWRGPDATIRAETVTIDWSPRALLSRQVVVKGIGAQSLRVSLAGQGGAAALPADLLVPFEITIERLGIARVDWSLGPRSGTITGLVFGYATDAEEHRIRDLVLVTEYGTVRGEARLKARAPFALEGRLDLAGDGMLEGATTRSAWSGTLEAPVAVMQGAFRGATFSARVELTPFATAPLAAVALDASEVDLASFDARLPVTQLSLTAKARMSEGRLDGRIDARNAHAGPIDAGRVPLAGLGADVAFDGTRLTFDDALATFAGGGRVSGSGTVVLSEPLTVRTALAVRDLDLVRLHSGLVATRLAGTIAVDLEGARRRVSGDIAQADLALSFAALVGDEHVEVERFRARAGEGWLEGRGRVALDAARAFEVTARAQAFDPSRFARSPRGRLSGDIALRGALAPDWQVSGDVKLARGSTLAEVALSGHARGSVSARRVRDLELDLSIASATVKAAGNAGAVGDVLDVALDVPRLDALAPLLPDAAPKPLRGSLRAQGKLRAEPGGIGGTASVAAHSLEAGADNRLARLQGRIAFDPGGNAQAPRPVTARELDLDVELTGLVHPQVDLASARLGARGTLGSHALVLAFRGRELDVEARARGALSGMTKGFDAASLEWSGTVESLAQREAPAFHLLAPVALTLTRGRLHLEATEIAIADGRARIESLDWVEGRATTRGSFTGVPLASLARLAGRPVPLVNDLVLGGEWSLAATPRTNGTLSVRRERGDLYFDDDATIDSGDIAFETSRLELVARFTEDALAAQGVLRSRLGGDADLAITLTPAGAGRVDRTAALALQVDADLPTLGALQGLVGTRAVIDGRARLSATARGTLAEPVLTGTLAADGLRLDAPQHGIALRDGRIRARLADDVLTLDELVLAGGDGRFTAQGVLTRPDAAKDRGGTRLGWRAEKFRLMNRPDRRLIVEGSGSFAIADRKLSITGSLRALEGHFEYTRPSGGQLGDDVVVVGRERTSADAVASRPQLPLTLDLDLDLGDGLTFTAEGLDATLAGRVRVTSDGRTLEGRGTISTVRGTYYAFGQRLTIDRGRLIFDGPLDNPALDIVALRRNLAVEAGVELTGTVRVPQVRLVSTPPVPDGEKLAWLITGSGLDRANAADLSALSFASATLLGAGGRPVTAQIAQRFGLDEISFHGGGAAGGAAGSAPLAGQVVTFGKRLTDRLTIAFEQGLTVANNAIRIEYALSRAITLRAEAGTVSNVGVFYRRSFE